MAVRLKPYISALIAIAMTMAVSLMVTHHHHEGNVCASLYSQCDTPADPSSSHASQCGPESDVDKAPATTSVDRAPTLHVWILDLLCYDLADASSVHDVSPHVSRSVPIYAAYSLTHSPLRAPPAKAVA